MIHRQALTATAAKIIYTTVQLCSTSCEGLVIVVCVCMDMAQYTVEQCVFLYESYVKCGSVRKCRRKFRHKFPRIIVLSTTDIHKLMKSGLLGHFWTRNLVEKTPCAYRRKAGRNRG
jgi:hypothetical protein